MNLPPVPESLRQLAQRQLDNEPVFKLRSIRKIMRDLATNARLMQSNIIQRTQQPGSLPHVDGGWANGADWSRLLGEYDKAIQALRAAWQHLKDTESAVQEGLQNWRELAGIAPDLILDEDSEEYWALFSRDAFQADYKSNPLIEAAIDKWSACTTRYFQLLKHTKTAPAYGPQLPSAKARTLILDNQEPDAAAA